MRARIGDLLRFVAIGLTVAISDGCTSSTTPGDQAAILLAIFAGDAQIATVGQAVATVPAVKATKNSQPAAGVVVTFAAATGGGSVTGATATTDASGIARAGGWTLGTTAGANTLTASAQGATAVTFTATGGATFASTMTKSAGDGQTSAAGVALATRPAVKVTDQFGNAVAAMPITFALASGGGSISGVAQSTGADGVATLGGWTLGTLVGANTVTANAMVSGISIAGNPSTFTATGVAGPVAALTKIAGDNQLALPLALLPVAPSVRLADQFGNLAGSRPVTFAVGSGAGVVTGATPMSGSNGVATVGGWTLGAAAGANTLSATSNSIAVTFTATATAAFNALQYVGTYTGPWYNTTFASTGTGTATITVNSAASTASVNVVATGPVLGNPGGVTTTQNGPYIATGASLTNAVIPVMGTVSGTIDAAGNLTASGSNIPNPAISRWNASGTITATQIRMTFTVTFVDGSTAVGTIALNHT